MNPKPKFLCDVDGPVADMIGAFRRWTLNSFRVDIPEEKILFHNHMGRSPGLQDEDRRLRKWFPGDSTGDSAGIAGAFQCFMKDRDVYGTYVWPTYGAVDAISTIRETYDVVFVTALMKSARDHFRSKMEWLERWFPGVEIITCPSSLKHLVAGQVAVDDRYDTVKRWADAAGDYGGGGAQIGYVFKRPWSEIPSDSGWIGKDWEDILTDLEEED